MRFRIRNLVLAAAVYLVVAVVLAQESFGPLGAALVYSGICMLLTWYMIANAETRRTGETIEFNQLNPASSLGVQYESFHHVFNSQEPVIEALLKNISTALVSKLGCSPLRQITLKDVDKELPKPESRVFYLSTAPLTVRKSEITLLCTFSREADVQGLRWWAMVLGQRDPNVVFWRYALSPIFLPLTIMPFLKGTHDPLRDLVKIYPGFFNSIDVLSRIREVQFVAFETVVETLDSFGIDTSNLKLQKGNILNINVSGGQTSFGSVVQGTMNKALSGVGR